jgi:L-ribulose-5-phosphate 4-epimerase
MYEKEKQDIIKAALEIKANRLIELSGGNVSMRQPNGDIIITPSGMSYEGMVSDDLIVMDIEGKVIEGTRRPSVDTEAILYIYKHMPEVNAVIHTHQPYATAAGLIGDTLPVAVTTLSNVTLGEVNVAPFSSPATIDMGIQAVNYANGKRAVILKHLGVITMGSNLKEALYAAVYMETAAKTYLVAKAAGEPALMNAEQNRMAVEIFKDYGQK